MLPVTKIEKHDFIELSKDIIPLILQGDVIESLQKIPDNSVSVVVTFPPYWNLRDYECNRSRKSFREIF